MAQKTAIQVVHSALKSAKDKVSSNTEVIRIFFNASKVLTHLWGTLTFCVVFPESMKKLLELTSVFALDIFSETRMPCAVPRPPARMREERPWSVAETRTLAPRPCHPCPRTGRWAPSSSEAAASAAPRPHPAGPVT